MKTEAPLVDLTHSVSILNPQASALDLVDAITRRLSQAKAMAILPNTVDGCDITENYLWAIEGQIEETKVLFEYLINKIDLE